jgi:hypothetical protein
MRNGPAGDTPILPACRSLKLPPVMDPLEQTPALRPEGLRPPTMPLVIGVAVSSRSACRTKSSAALNFDQVAPDRCDQSLPACRALS